MQQGKDEWPWQGNQDMFCPGYYLNRKNAIQVIPAG